MIEACWLLIVSCKLFVVSGSLSVVSGSLSVNLQAKFIKKYDPLRFFFLFLRSNNEGCIENRPLFSAANPLN